MSVKKEVLEKELIPEMPEDKSPKTNYKVKDEYLTKKATYIDAKTRVEMVRDVDWISLNIGGLQMVLKKDVPLTKNQLSSFDEKAKKYWLTKIK